MKVTIERVFKPVENEHWFYLKVDNPYFGKSFIFKPDAPEGDIYNEKAAYEEALEIALRIEKFGTPEPKKEIIYEREIPDPEEKVNPEAANQ